MNDFYYRKLDAYQLSKELTIMVYTLLRAFPEYERYGMSDQLRRAAVSIPSNIAEGMGRMAIKERTHFIDFSYGSLCEIMCQMEIALSLNYISQQQFFDFESLAIRVSKTLIGLKNSLSKKIQNNNSTEC
ncbi:MAG: four helix bundle protein [Prevotella sp.]|nr:four helix bundle protein [Prevotella sp.]